MKLSDFIYELSGQGLSRVEINIGIGEDGRLVVSPDYVTVAKIVIEPMGSQVDYRGLLKKYMAEVVFCESVDFIPDSPSDKMSQEDITALNKCSDELVADAKRTNRRKKISP